MKGLILEGITGSGKTSILNKIKEKIFFRNIGESLILFTQAYTQRLIEHFGQDKSEEGGVKLLNDIISPLENINRRFIESVFNNSSRKNQLELYFLLETCHINHILEFKFSFSPPYKMVDLRLKELNAKTIILYIPYKEIYERCITSTKENRGVKWVQYLEKKGLSNNELITFYSDQQKKLLEYNDQSKIPSKVINTRLKNWNDISEDIINYWIGSF